jgi:hypothetical protein
MQDILGPGIAGSVFFVSIVPFTLLALAVPYLVLRLRSEGPEDPQLGAKIGLQFFFSVAILLGLTGLTISAVDFLARDDLFGGGPQHRQPGMRPIPADDDGFNSAQRAALGMIISSALLALVHFLMSMVLTNSDNWWRVRRTFAGWRFVIHGVVVGFAGTVLVIMLLQKNAFEPPSFRAIRAVFAVLVVWTPSWLLNLVLLRVYSHVSREVRRVPTAAEVKLEDMDMPASG